VPACATGGAAPTDGGGIDRRLPYTPHTLILLELGEAYRRDGNASVVFMDTSWSHRPAKQWVPAMLEGVWRRTQMAQ
jgi:hypothetical protein